ncbi:M50 family metallopeptidase [Nocardia sp. NPDC049190]|uniref:M50 family metallopeptidase n=1 Tax=Nocardia sp. NPDC049190 TaxID=3155650 RepID=UPI0033F0CC0E
MNLTEVGRPPFRPPMVSVSGELATGRPATGTAELQPTSPRGCEPMKLTDAERERIAVAFHEAGHAIAAVLAGGRVTEVTLSSGPDAHGQCQTADLPTSAEALVAVAGPWAAARWTTGAVPSWRDVRDELAAQPDDFAVVAAASPDDDPYRVGRWLETVWPAVRELSATLYRDGRIGHRQITEALGLPLWGVETSAVAASIKSGCWSPPVKIGVS